MGSCRNGLRNNGEFYATGKNESQQIIGWRRLIYKHSTVHATVEALHRLSKQFPIHFSFHGENLLITQGKRNISTESAEPTYSSRLCLSYRSFYSASASWSVYQATRTPTGACEAILVNHRRLFRNEKVLISSENLFSIKIDEWSVINVQRFTGLIGCSSSCVSVICSCASL